VSQPDHAAVNRSPEGDPLLEFFAEPGFVPVIPDRGAPPAPAESSQPVEKAADAHTPVGRVEADDLHAELRGRIDRAERLLDKTLIEVSSLKSDLATLVSALEDIRKKQSRRLEFARPLGPPAAPSRFPRLGTAAAALALIVCGLALWGAFSIASYDISEPPPIDGGAGDTSSAPAEAAPAATAMTPPVAIQQTAAVATVLPSRDVPAGDVTAGAVPVRDAPVRNVPARPGPARDVAARDVAARATADPRIEKPERAEPRMVTNYVGTLTVDANPEGEVFLNRKNVGRTPVRLENLRAGSHLIWIERDGYRRWTRVVPVAADRVSRVSADLELLPR
jgi:hypothetical protein